MYEIRQAGLKGLGIFATRQIAQGTRILAENPLIAVRGEHHVFAAVRRLGQADRKQLMSLSVSPVKRSILLSWVETAWHAAKQAPESVTQLLRGANKERTFSSGLTSIAEYPAVLSVFRNNNFDLGNGIQAVFGSICRLNHACTPNAQGNFNAALDRFTVHATRTIEVDEEITLSYLAERGAPRDSRQRDLLAKYGFDCDCPACDANSERGTASEDRRVQMASRLREYAEQSAENEHSDAAAELSIMKDMLSMYAAEGIAGRELATMHLTAAELAVKAGDTGSAALLVDRGLKLDQDCCGSDSPLFKESVARAHAIKAAS